ncbi:MAG: hypothetical protein J4G05_09585 [Chlorobi bacterium]|nr:hypothetical protein [Chlorobiota bacterium]
MDEERRKDISDAWDWLHKYQLSNSQLFDRSILWLSSAGLGFSLAFIRNIVPLDNAVNVCFLHYSWWAFIFVILITLCSFLISQCGIEKQFAQSRSELEGNEDHKPSILISQCGIEKQLAQSRSELEGNEDHKPSINGKDDLLFRIVKYMSYVSMGFYIFAIIFTTLFIQFNT